MNFEGKKKMQPLSQNSIEQLCMILGQAKQTVENAEHTLGDSVAYVQMRELVENVYQLGHLKDVYEVFGGYTNRSFGVIVDDNGTEKEYFIRKYKMGVTDADMRVEHDMIAYAESHGMDKLAHVFATPDGRTFHRMNEIINGEKVSRAFAVYTFLDGDDRYTWIDTKMTKAEDESFGEMLAAFHSSTYGYNPGEKAEPPIITFTKQLAGEFPSRCENLPKGNQFRMLWEKELKHMVAICEEANKEMSKVADKLPECCCHCDYHPGNVKWTNEECSGLFDLDWSKLDKRLYDFCYAVLYTTSSWDAEDNGRFDIPRIQNMLRGYQRSARKCGSIGPITKDEARVFGQMMKAAAIYLLNWCTTYCADADNMNEYEYYFYLSHTVNALYDIENRNDEMVKAFLELCD